MPTIEKMTLTELQGLIDQRIDERLATFFGHFEIDDDELLVGEEADERTWDQVKQDIEHDRWTPPPGAKSSLELLREDREN